MKIVKQVFRYIGLSVCQLGEPRRDPTYRNTDTPKYLLAVIAILFSMPLSAQQPAKGGGELFEALLPVLHHPRCMNCHSQGDYPRQGDDMHPHTMNVRRAGNGLGVTAQKCATCHQDHNLAGANLPPGAPNWRLPPANMPMIWEGLSDRQLCEALKDPRQNRNRTVAQIVEHMTSDKLVLWGWNPGEGRTPVPVSQADFAARAKRWQAAGAGCPAN